MHLRLLPTFLFFNCIPFFIEQGFAYEKAYPTDQQLLTRGPKKAYILDAYKKEDDNVSKQLHEISFSENKAPEAFWLPPISTLNLNYNIAPTLVLSSIKNQNLPSLSNFDTIPTPYDLNPPNDIFSGEPLPDEEALALASFIQEDTLQPSSDNAKKDKKGIKKSKKTRKNKIIVQAIDYVEALHLSQPDALNTIKSQSGDEISISTLKRRFYEKDMQAEIKEILKKNIPRALSDKMNETEKKNFIEALDKSDKFRWPHHSGHALKKLKSPANI